jgi:spore coat polysaccharide biosynthesis predicted glycosyltransferase SpsG
MLRTLIRADAGLVPEIGTGHVIRSLRLADALYNRPVFSSGDIVFATRTSYPFELGSQLIKKAGYKKIADSGLEPNTESELLSILDAKPDVVIFDRLSTSESLILELKKRGIFVVTFDDLGRGRYHANLAINALLQDATPFENTVTGLDYLLSTSNEIPLARATRKEVENIFISFGGFDQRKLTIWLLSLLSNITVPKRYEVIISGLSPSDREHLLDEVRFANELLNREIVLHDRPTEFYKILSECDVAIISGGLTAFDCAQSGVPAIGLPQYEHQIQNLYQLEKLGCLRCGTRGMELNTGLFCNVLNSLILNFDERQTMAFKGRQTIDGRGLMRCVDRIESSYSVWLAALAM